MFLEVPKIVFALLRASFFVKVVLFHANEIVFPKPYSAQVDIKKLYVSPIVDHKTQRQKALEMFNI